MEQHTFYELLIILNQCQILNYYQSGPPLKRYSAYKKEKKFSGINKTWPGHLKSIICLSLTKTSVTCSQSRVESKEA